MKNIVGIIVAGSIAGIVGAALWALIAYKLGVEIGWVAWFIGGLVGFAVNLAGGKGGNAGMTAAVIAVLAICCGKIITVEMLVSKEIEERYSGNQARQEYDEMERNARVFQQVTSKEQYAEFMVQQKYTEAETPDKVMPFEIEKFEMVDVPELQSFATNYHSYDEWKTKMIRKTTLDMGNKFSVWDELKATLGFLDVLFFFLGIGTAVRVGSGLSNEQ